MDTVKIAFAGFRHSHIFDLYERVKNDDAFIITATYEGSSEGQEKMKSRGITVTHSDYSAFIAECDAEIIAIGDYYAARGNEAIAALKAGKHIISDKPLCTSIKELNEIAELCKERSLSVLLMLDLRYHPQFIKAQEVILSGKLGEIKSIQFNGAHDIDLKNRPHWYFEKGKHGGTINDLAVHGIDMVSYLTGLDFGSAVAAVQKNAYVPQFTDFKDSATFMYTLENGALVTADTSYCSPTGIGYTLPQYWRFNVWGTRGMLECSEASGEVKLHMSGAVETLLLMGENTTDDALGDLLAQINGKSGRLSTASSLKAARIALTLQQIADNQ